jgi:hypothetical protein
MREIRKHLEHCTECKEGFALEQVIAAGTQSWARSAMKQKLAGRLASRPDRHIPWPRVLGVAALLIVIVGVGIIFRWRDAIHQPLTAASDSVPADAAIKSQPPPAALPNDSKRPIAQAEKTIIISDRLTARPEKKEISAAEQSAPAAAPAIAEAEKDLQAEMVSKGDITEQHNAPASMAEGFWLSGTASGALSGGKLGVPAGASQQGYSLERRDAVRSAAKTKFASRTFIIGQSLRRTLAETSNLIQAQSVPTYVERSGDTLRLTLYLDSLMTPPALQATYAREITQDSFQVILPDRILGYRIPPTLTR